MQGLLIIGGIVLAVAFIRSATHGTSGMNDKPVSIDNIRRGVQNGWYKATLCTDNGKPAVILSGKNTDGKIYTDIYPISYDDWETLRKEGYEVEL